jgi:hypothetical protein
LLLLIDPFFKLVNLPFNFPTVFSPVKACRHDESLYGE